MRKTGGGAGSSMEPPAAVRRSHARGARQQTQFTKRHLFHYSNALWLITSWPVCEMTATYSPVNRKICTCSIRGVGEQRSGAAKGKEKRQEKTQEITLSGETVLVLLGRNRMRNSVSTRSSEALNLRWKNVFSQLLLFLPIQRPQCQGLVPCSSPSSLPQGCGLGTNRLAHLLQSPGPYKKRQLVRTRVRLLMEWGRGSPRSSWESK